MKGLLAAGLTFGLLVAAQFAVWRIVRPAGHYIALSLLSLVVLLVAAASLWALGAGAHVPVAPATLAEWVSFAMLYTAATLAYMVTYSAVQGDSPSMAILLRIDAAGPRGLSREEMIGILNDAVVVIPRLQDLVVGNLAVERAGRYVITSQGSLLARIYIGYRALLKMEKGG